MRQWGFLSKAARFVAVYRSLRPAAAPFAGPRNTPQTRLERPPRMPAPSIPIFAASRVDPKIRRQSAGREVSLAPQTYNFNERGVVGEGEVSHRTGLAKGIAPQARGGKGQRKMSGPTKAQLLERRRMSATVFLDTVHRFRNGTDQDMDALGEIYKANRSAWEKGAAAEWGSLVNLKPALLREWREKFSGKGARV
jgi:hypothetical protein